MILIFVCFSILISKYEVTFLLMYISIIACEAAVGLALLVRLVRFEDKRNVKGNIFGCF